jgi:hypothetical protein
LRKLGVVLCTAVIGVAVAAQTVHASQTFDAGQRRPIFVTLPPRGVDFTTLGQPNANMTVPFFTNTVTSPLDGKTYTFRMVGTDPSKTPASTTVKYVPIVLRVHFADGTVLDPTKPGCNDTVSVEKRFFGSPLFHSVKLVSNGINVGTTQIEDAFQRANFWSMVGGTGFHVLLAPAMSPILVDVTAPSGSVTSPGACPGKAHNLGQININAYDNIVVQLNNKYAKTTQLPIVAAYNVVETFGGCCIIGYHNAYGRSGGTQTYAVGAYTDAGIFSPGIQDIHAWTHELGEWMDDPFINNATPSWGHVGQQPGCQNNLEVGDPLTGTPFIVQFNGFTYHPQELAFFSWFFRTPATGTGGEFSFEGTFESSQPQLCH